MILFYVRHGDPIYNPDSLTQKGHDQAKALATRFAVNGLDELYVSPLNRARQTAQPTEQALGKTATVIDWLSEGYAWDRLTVTKDDGTKTWFYQHEPSIKLFMSQEIASLGNEWYNHTAFANTRSKEAVLQMRQFVTDFLAKLEYNYDEQTKSYVTNNVDDDRRIALFAHEGIGMLFLSTLLNIPYPMFCTRFCIGHTGVTAIHFEKNVKQVIPKVLQLSNDSHLYQQELPTLYHNTILI